MDTAVFARPVGYMDLIVRKVIEIWLHPDNFNRDRTHSKFFLNPTTNILQQSRGIKQQ
jgi:hypothetical protein